MSPSRNTRDLLDCISITWINVFGDLKLFTLDEETGMMSKDVFSKSIKFLEDTKSGGH